MYYLGTCENNNVNEPGMAQSITLCKLGKFSHFCCRLLAFSKLTFSKDSFRNTISMSNSFLIWMQTVCKAYQQGRKIAASMEIHYSLRVKKEERIRNRYNQVPHLKHDKNTIARKRHTPESQEVSPFSAGDHKATRNRQVKFEI